MGDLEVSGLSPEANRRVRSLYRRGGSRLAVDVLEDARDESSPLHQYFEWDDGDAAESFRLLQAQALVRRVTVTVLRPEDSVPVRVRAFVAAKDVAQEPGQTEPGTYLDVVEVAGESAAAVALRESMLRDVRRLRRRYEDTSMLLDVWQQVMSAD